MEFEARKSSQCSEECITSQYQLHVMPVQFNFLDRKACGLSFCRQPDVQRGLNDGSYKFAHAHVKKKKGKKSPSCRSKPHMTLFVVSVKHKYSELVFHAGTEAYKLKKRCKTTIKK